MTAHQTPIETTHVPGYIGTSFNPLVGCSGKRPCVDWCWARHRVVPRWRHNPGVSCQACREFTPHFHPERLYDVTGKNAIPRCYFMDMAEPNDFPDEPIHRIMETIISHPWHLFQIITQDPWEFYLRFPSWPPNVMAMGTWTEGAVGFPHALRAGELVAYIEPLQGPVHLDTDLKLPTWIVIGCQTGKAPVEPESKWVLNIMLASGRHNIPLFQKPHPVWRRMGLVMKSEWPRRYAPDRSV